MSDNKVDLELELSNRMAGEVYPELLLLMKKTNTAVVFIKINDAENECTKLSFSISTRGVITDLIYFSNDDDAVNEAELTRLETQAGIFTNDLEVDEDARVLVMGEADDYDDDYSPREFNIQNINECPIYENYENVEYPDYCERVLDIIERLFEKDKRIHNLMSKIDRIPYRKFVIIEKTKK